MSVPSVQPAVGRCRAPAVFIASLASSSQLQKSEPAGLDDAGSFLTAGERDGHENREFDPTLLLAAKESLAEHLTQALREHLPSADTVLIDYLVGNLDGDGYLHTTVQEAAGMCETAPERVERVLAVLQAQEPPGVGARNVRECLLIQMQHLEAQGVCQPYARQIIDQHLSQLAHHQHHQIAGELGISLRHIKEAQAFIKRELHPHPTAGYLGAEVSVADGLAGQVQPDVVISCNPDASDEPYEVEVVEAQRFDLHVSPSYTEAARSLAGQRISGDAAELHVQDYLKRTRLFLANVERRWQTLHQITSCLVRHQHAFLEHGSSALQPLTRGQVAEALGVHPSTVSRATAAKYVMLPNKQVIPFRTFFTANLSLKEALKDLIRLEEQPLSDQELTDRLQVQGWQVARRTVAKYREELKILPSSER